MCGISVIIAPQKKEYARFIKRMSDPIKHRGPDDEGYLFFSLDSEQPLGIYAGEDSSPELFSAPMPYSPRALFRDEPGHLAFGHRRLSIIDLSIYGHQPMCDAAGRYWITYNGEVYNFLELKEELIKLGHKFNTHCDTEVIIHAYMEWGEECLHHFNGMFAFVIYDAKERTVFGARDRFGVKPFYYWRSPEGFLAMASEIKQFTVLPGWLAKVNPQLAYDFLNWGLTNHSVETCFKGVYQLYGGHCLKCKLSEGTSCKVEQKKWYHLPTGDYKGSLEQAGEKFKHLLAESIKLRCRADVSVGSCLSGGLDSSAIVCLAHSILQEQKSVHPQMTFSACSHYPQFDEREYMEYVIGQTNVNPFFTYPDADQLIEQLELITWHQDEPFGSTSIFAQWEVFNLVKQNGVKVMLDGQGADEQLAGYGGFHSARFADLAKGFRFLQLRKELRKCKELHQMIFPLKFLFSRILPDWIKQPILRNLGKTTIDVPWIDKRVLSFEKKSPHDCDVPLKSELQKLCYSQVTRTNLPMLLHFEDRDSMAHSIEARTPFLDYRLVEFIQSLPPEYKLSEGISKRVLREGLKGVLPEKIRTRTSKLGFATPEEMWVRKEHPELFRKMVGESIKASQGILNSQTMQAAGEIIDGKAPFNFLLWRFIIFGQWMKRFSMGP